MNMLGCAQDLSLAMKLAIVACGVYFLTGLLTGIWKYRWMLSDSRHQAPVYVDIAHRAALLYSFACLVLLKLIELSPLDEAIETVATAAPIAFFGIAIGTYIVLGLRREADTQFRHRTWQTTWGMWLLIMAEIGGVAVLFGGALSAL